MWFGRIRPPTVESLNSHKRRGLLPSAAIPLQQEAVNIHREDDGKIGLFDSNLYPKMYEATAAANFRQQNNFQESAAGGVWIAPDPLERQAPGMGRDQLMDRFRPPISGGIKPHRRRRLEQRHRHLPKPLDALRGREQRMVAAHRVEDQALIGFEHLADQAGVVHGE